MTDSRTHPSGVNDVLGVEISGEFLEQALTHRSFSYENGGVATSERLEFLGDAVLGAVVTELLFLRYPDATEGELSKRRSAIVSTNSLAGIARQYGLGQFLRLGKGEEQTGGREKDSLLADLVESIIGAVFLTSGMAEAKAFILRLIADSLAKTEALGDPVDPKTELQELASLRGMGSPVYHITAEGPDHERTYTAQVEIGVVKYASGVGTSKKRAEMAAALLTWRELKQSSAQ